MTKTNTNVYQKTRSQQGRERAKERQTSLQKQNLPKRRSHAPPERRSLSAVRPCPAYSSHAWICVPFSNFLCVHSCCCSYCRCRCCCCSFYNHAGVKRCMGNKLLVLLLLLLSLCVQKPATNARTQTCKQDAPTALPAALLCFAWGWLIRLSFHADAARTKAPSKDTAKFFLLYSKVDRTHSHTRTQHARTPTTNVYGTLIE